MYSRPSSLAGVGAAGECQPVRWTDVEVSIDADGGATIAAPAGAVRIEPGTRGWVGPTLDAFRGAFPTRRFIAAGVQGTYRGDGVLRPDQTGAVWVGVAPEQVRSWVRPECPPDVVDWRGVAPAEGQAPIHVWGRKIQGFTYAGPYLLVGQLVPGIEEYWDLTGRAAAFWGPVSPRDDRYSVGVLEVLGWAPTDEPAPAPAAPTPDDELTRLEEAFPGTAGEGTLTPEQAAAVEPTDFGEDFAVATGEIATVVPVLRDDEGMTVGFGPGEERRPDVAVSEGLVSDLDTLITDFHPAATDVLPSTPGGAPLVRPSGARGGGLVTAAEAEARERRAESGERFPWLLLAAGVLGVLTLRGRR